MILDDLETEAMEAMLSYLKEQLIAQSNKPQEEYEHKARKRNRRLIRLALQIDVIERLLDLSKQLKEAQQCPSS